MGAATPKTIALVTGANQGLGFEIAKKLSLENEGYHVIMAGRRKEAVDEAVGKLESLGCSVEGLVMDVTSDQSIAEAADTVRSRHGHLDVLINNAGINASAGSPREQWMGIFNTKVFGVALITDAFLPLLEKSTLTKRIVMMSSTLGSLGKKLDKTGVYYQVDTPIYATSKAALDMLTLHYVFRYRDDPTWKINLCCPGYCSTNMNGFHGADDPQLGAVNACRLATLGPDGETGTWTDRHGSIPW